MILIGIDGGGTTGLCIYNTENPEAVSFQEVPNGLKGFTHFYQQNKMLFEASDLVIAEKFRLDKRTEQPDLTTVQINALLDHLAYTDDLPLIFMSTAESKHKLPNRVLKGAGLYPKRGQVKGGHAVDALRLILAHLVAQRDLPTIERLWPKEAE